MHDPVRSISGKLRSRQGFTIVELLIVIIVIGILAAITIVAYNGIARQATEASMKSDLRNASQVVQLDYTSNGSYPVDAASASDGQGLKSSGSNVLSYQTKAYGYCIAISNAATSTSFRITSRFGQIQAGTCDTTVSTFAGSGTQSYADGTGTAAHFHLPLGIGADRSGIVYVSDSYNHRIRKITPEGVVTTFAGSGVIGSADDTGTAAQFYYPEGIVIDDSGTVYIADGHNHRIRKITSSGVVTTLAGSSLGYADGTGTAARFHYPNGIALSSNGDIYLADGNNHRIRKITQAGVVTTFAGSGTAGTADGTGTAAEFNVPEDIAIDAEDNLYVVDSFNHRIRKITPAGVVTTLAGSTQGYADGTGAAALFNTPEDITIDTAGLLYIADTNNHRIRMITPTGTVTTLAGTGGNGYVDGLGTVAQIRLPEGIATDLMGSLYVIDNNSRVRKIMY